MDPNTFEHLKPTDVQLARMTAIRAAAKLFCAVLEAELPGGPDKTFIIRSHCTTTVWANVAITRYADGAPRPWHRSGSGASSI